MNYIFDKEKLKNVLFDFYKSTGIAIALYDADENIVATSPIYTGCCSFIRDKKQCRKNCDRSDLDHMKEVSRNRGIIRYTCHAGLMETMVPIEYENVLIAYLQIGQFRDEEQVYSSVEKIAETAKLYGFDADKLLSLYIETPVVSEEKLNALCNIMEIIIRSFWSDGLIKYKRSMLSVKIERYIDEHLTENIYLDELCEKFFVSKNSIYELFKTELNTTVNKFINQKRLEKAKNMLVEHPELNISQIAAVCGFSDYNYFIRLYKKHYGITPLQAKKSKKA